MDAHSAIRDVLWRGTSVRVALVVLSCVLDELPQLHVRYTDVDYSVFTDASRLLADARSPFERATFRYSPLLALVLLPNVYVHQSAGKLLFCAADMAVAYCIYLLNLRPSKAGVGYSEANAARRARLWAYNPLAIAICTRGSCDSLTSLAVLSVLYLLQLGRSRTAAVLYGLCVHFRVYPLIYSVALFLCIARRGAYRAQLPLFDALRSAEAWAFAAVSIACCGACTLASYSFCGKEYIREALLYHLTRTDHRHNFSPHFYWILLNEGRPSLTRLCGLFALLPQASVLVLCAVRYAHTDLAFCLLIQTMVFVTFNKVCTAQYFVWYAALIPVALTNVHLNKWDMSWALGVWVVALAVWLLNAYQLEFTSTGQVHAVWLASLAFMCVNAAIIHLLLHRHTTVCSSFSADKKSN